MTEGHRNIEGGRRVLGWEEHPSCGVGPMGAEASAILLGLGGKSLCGVQRNVSFVHGNTVENQGGRIQTGGTRNSRVDHMGGGHKEVVTVSATVLRKTGEELVRQE